MASVCQMRSNTASQTWCKTAGKTPIDKSLRLKGDIIDSEMFQQVYAILNTVPEADQEAVGGGHCITKYLTFQRISTTGKVRSNLDSSVEQVQGPLTQDYLTVVK